MSIPTTLSETLLYSTVRLETSDGSSGTGFFFNFLLPENKQIPIIITNKHVINNNQQEKVSFVLHTKDSGGPGNKQVTVKLRETHWYFHKDQDLCFCFANPIFEEVTKENHEGIFYTSIPEDLIWDNKKLQSLSVIEDIVMIGYPNGLWDEKNNFPLFRKGISASHPAIDFNHKNVGAVDVASFPGSSGSPILILNENGYTDKKGTTFIGTKRLILLGILFAGPLFNTKGKLVVEDIPTQQTVSPLTPQMINLGYYIKASEILSFKHIIIDFFHKTQYD
jgi:hypothetical protein